MNKKKQQQQPKVEATTPETANRSRVYERYNQNFGA